MKARIIKFLNWIFHKNVIFIDNRIKDRELYRIHLCLFIYFPCLMMLTDSFVMKANEIQNMSLSFWGIFCLFVQCGGLSTILILGISILYNKVLEETGHNYFIQRHPWLEKVFYTCLCLYIALWYALYAHKNNNVNCLTQEYKFMMTWLISMGGIWIFFGIKKPNKKSRQKANELNRIIGYLFSVVVIPIIYLIYYFVIGDQSTIGKNIYRIALAVVTGGIVIGICHYLKYNKGRRIGCWSIRWKCKHLFGHYTGYYRNIGYQITKMKSEKDKYQVEFIPQEICLDQKMEFPIEFQKEIYNLCQKFTLTDIPKTELETNIINAIDNLGERRKQLIGQAYAIAWKKSIENEKCIKTNMEIEER